MKKLLFFLALTPSISWASGIYNPGSSSGGGGGSGTTIWTQLNGAAVDNAVSTINFTGPALAVASSPSGRVTVAVTSTLPSGATNYIQNTPNPTTATQTFTVSSQTTTGVFTQNTDGSWVPNNILSINPDASQNGFFHTANHLIQAQLNEDSGIRGKFLIRSSTGSPSNTGADYSEIQLLPPSSTSNGSIVFGLKNNPVMAVDKTGFFVEGNLPVKFLDGGGSNYTALIASVSVASSIQFVLPAADGKKGQTLITDGSGNLGFGSASRSVTSVSVNYVIASTDDFIAADATSASITTTLPTAVGVAGQIHTVKRTNSGGNTVTIATTSSQTIDGSLTQVLTTQYTSVDLISDGSNWSIL